MKQQPTAPRKNALPTNDGLPTVAELAALAATLAAPGNGNEQTLAAAALNLWKAAAHVLDTERKGAARLAEQTKATAQLPPLPDKPLTNETLVTWLVPRLRGRTDAAAEVLRAYLGENYGKARHVQINRSNYDLAARLFLRFYDKWEKDDHHGKRSAAGKQGAKTKAAKAEKEFARWCASGGLKDSKKTRDQFKIERRGKILNPEEQLLSRIKKPLT